jgi:hypothetical protein
MTRLARTAAALAAAVLLALPVAAAAQGSGAPPQKVFGVKAASYGKTTLENGNFTYDVGREASVRDAAILINYTDRPINLRVYPADVISAGGGGLAPKQRDANMRTVGKWLRLDDPEQAVVGIAPRGRLTVPFTLSVPRFTAPGEYPGALVVATDLGDAGHAISVQTRAALFVRLRVPGKIDQRAGVSQPKPHAVRDGYRFETTVTNRGNVLFTVLGQIELRQKGKRIDSVELSPREIYVIPRGKSTLSGVWTKPPRLGRVQAIAHVRTFINGEEAKVFSSEPKSFTYVPWKLVGGALGLLGAAGLAWFLLRKRFRGWRARHREDREVVRRHRALENACQEIAGDSSSGVRPDPASDAKESATTTG